MRVALAALTVLCLPGSGAGQTTADPEPQPQRILILHQERPTVPTAALNKGFMSAIRKDTTVHREVFIEYLDWARNTDTTLQNAQLNYLKLKYQRIDVAVAIGSAAYRILTDPSRTIAPGADVLFWVNEATTTVRDDTAAKAAWADERTAGGIVTKYDVAGTASDILTMLPETRKLLVVSGVSSLDSLALLHGLSELQGIGSIVDIEKMVGATQPQFLARAAGLPPNSAILLLNFIGDSLGNKYFPGDVTSAASRVSKAPIFGVSRALLGSGVIGGRMLDHEDHGRQLGELAISVLNGQRTTAQVRWLTNHSPVFDAPGLQEWGIPEEALPENAEVQNRNDIPWDLYRHRILAVLAVCLAEALLIGGMLLQRRRRARAERLLADRLHFETILADASRTFADVSPYHIALETSRWLRRICTMAEARQAAILLFERDGVHLRRAESWRGADAAENVLSRIDVDALIELKSGHVTTVRLTDVRPSRMLVLIPIHVEGSTTGVLLLEVGTNRLFGQSVPLERSRVLGEIVASAIARRQATEELARRTDALRASHAEYRRLADSLVEAQENERRRIARELHDDIAQRLTLLSLEAGEIGRRAGEASNVPRSAIEHLGNELGSLVADMSRVSHRLHPSVLEKIGLAGAIRSLTSDLAACCRIPITFEEENVPASLPNAGSLTVYRVAQEALRNAIRHSDATRIVVRLVQTNGILTIEIIDDGKGLDVDRIRKAPGLGITSMAERVHVLGGTFTIQSRSDVGTVVRAAIRLASDIQETLRTGNSIEAALR